MVIPLGVHGLLTLLYRLYIMISPTIVPVYRQIIVCDQLRQMISHLKMTTGFPVTGLWPVIGHPGTGLTGDRPVFIFILIAGLRSPGIGLLTVTSGHGTRVTMTSGHGTRVTVVERPDWSALAASETARDTRR